MTFYKYVYFLKSDIWSLHNKWICEDIEFQKMSNLHQYWHLNSAHDELIGPFFFTRTLSAKQTFFLCQRTMHYAYPLLITRQPGVMFRLDGAPAHWRAFLNASFPQHWIGRDGPTPLPPRSPDINHLDFFVGIREDPCIQNTCARFTESQTSHQAGIWRSHKHHA